jgi:hypothetical protein
MPREWRTAYEQVRAEEIQRNNLLLASLGFEPIDDPGTSSTTPAVMLFVFVLSLSVSLRLSVTLTLLVVHLILVVAKTQPDSKQPRGGTKRCINSAPAIELVLLADIRYQWRGLPNSTRWQSVKESCNQTKITRAERDVQRWKGHKDTPRGIEYKDTPRGIERKFVPIDTPSAGKEWDI